LIHFYKSLNGIKMSDLVEFGRRLKRSLDGNISYRKAAALTLFILVFLFYVGPGFVRWMLGMGQVAPLTPLSACLARKMIRYQDLVTKYNGHRDGDMFVPYTGNGYLGLSVSAESQIYIKNRRSLSLPVDFKPLVHLFLEGGGDSETAQVTDYLEGTVTSLQCLGGDEWTTDPVTVTSTVLAHRILSGVLIQEVKIHNPGKKVAQLSLEKLGIAQWEGATSQTKVIEHGEGGQRYTLVTGEVGPEGRRTLVSVVSKKLDSTVEVQPRMTASIKIITGVSYHEIGEADPAKLKEEVEKEAMEGVKAAAAMTWQSLLDSHSQAWRSLWTTGLGISWSYADGAVNGDRINATIYYVLSQSSSLLHEQTSQTKRTELQGYLSYAEGCYTGVRTLQAKNLWTPLSTVSQVLNVANMWLLTLEKNGCHNLLKAGADGVVQAMVLSLPGLKFSNQHLELDVHPRELHRDIMLRRVNYGNETHVNVTISVMDDNRAALFVSLDKRNRDYYACDAGCLDPPVKLGLVPVQFPVKLTDPVTAILYITADHEHMIDLKHTIHVKEVAEAPAHELHVLELHRSGGRYGGLPASFWFFIGALIIVFHLFLFKIIFNEYCAGQDRQRSRHA